MRLLWNDFKVWFKIKFSYPGKRNFEKIKSVIPAHLNLKQGIIIEENVTLSYHLKEIGKHVYIANNTFIDNCSKIGSFTSISSGVKIGLREHPLNFVSTSPVLYAKRRGWLINDSFNEFHKGCAEIGNDVLISANAIILSGVRIGDGAVIAAGAIVNKDVQPYSIVGGIPAKLLSYRFEEALRNELLKSCWWEEDDILLKNASVHANNPQVFLNKLKTDS